MTQPVTIDALDRAIIRQLQEDGRASYADLASVVGLSPPAVRQRMQRLMETGLLQVVAVTDPLKLGLPVMALVGIAVARRSHEAWKGQLEGPTSLRGSDLRLRARGSEPDRLEPGRRRDLCEVEIGQLRPQAAHVLHLLLHQELPGDQDAGEHDFPLLELGAGLASAAVPPGAA